MPIPHKWHFFAKNLAQLINLLYLCSRKGQCEYTRYATTTSQTTTYRTLKERTMFLVL